MDGWIRYVVSSGVIIVRRMRKRHEQHKQDELDEMR